MAIINRNILIPYLAAYKDYLDGQERKESSRSLSNLEEDYKRDIAAKAAEALNSDIWNEAEIGEGAIGGRTIKAVQRNMNLIGRFQVTSFSDKVKEDYSVSERVLFDLYHEHKDKECFTRICNLFGKKYDLVAYLYFIFDPNRYLPLRSSIFDGIFKKLGIDLQTTGRCSWENYQEFLTTLVEIRDVMKDYYQVNDIDLLDAHSFLWTIKMDAFNIDQSGEIAKKEPEGEKKIEVGVIFTHKDYGKGIVTKLTEEKIYIDFNGKPRIFPYPEAFEKEYLR